MERIFRSHWLRSANRCVPKTGCCTGVHNNHNTIDLTRPFLPSFSHRVLWRCVLIGTGKFYRSTQYILTPRPHFFNARWAYFSGFRDGRTRASYVSFETRVTRANGCVPLRHHAEIQKSTSPAPSPNQEDQGVALTSTQGTALTSTAEVKYQGTAILSPLSDQMLPTSGP